MTQLYDWARFKACGDLPKSTFYDFELHLPLVVPQEAKDACNRCPVRDSCLEHALKFESFGYWAGTTPAMRRRIRKQRGIVVQPMQGVNFDELVEVLLSETRAPEYVPYDLGQLAIER